MAARDRHLVERAGAGATALIFISLSVAGCSPFPGRNTNLNQPAVREAAPAAKEVMDRISSIDFGPGITPAGTITVDSCGIVGVNTSINFVPDDPSLRCTISKVILYEVTLSPDARAVATALDKALVNYEIPTGLTFTEGSYAGAIADGEDWVAQAQGGVPDRTMLLEFFRPGPTHLGLVDYLPSGALEKPIDKDGDTTDHLIDIARTSTASFIFIADWSVEYFDNSITGTD